ncbi:Cleavage and polyadenylation specificity like protein [Argiope bruennichi]|uniref:Cleavage and polyadenylation specificity factor subunit 2 n=1 Tax=Argiope bruennichi TaxID=94029 RepID=A0A8T0EFT0_ARGBR|nr:Cleavage and polyadenylation specificity like protein [Argiope bruennichi]
MTSIIKLLPLSGVHGEDPHCYILQVDEFKFLLDCGWDENFNMAHIKELKKHIHQIDSVLLSYPDILHLGALPYVVGKCNLDCPIYSTIPVYKMGQMFMYDLYQSRNNIEDFDLFTLDDVDAAFDKIIQLKYSQTINLKGKGQGIAITPLPGGHMIGGAIWKIVKDGEEDIIYAVDFNHKKERHLNGCILETINRPSLLITDSYNATYVQPRRRLRDEQLMTNVLQTLRNSGNVLIAVDTAGRVLELAHMMDQIWRSQDSGLMSYSLALLNNVSYNVVEFAKSQLLNIVQREFGGSDSSEESEDEMEVDRGGSARHDLMMKVEGKPRGGGFFKQAKKSYPMFPVKEEKIKWDDYGEIIKLEDYMILEPTTMEEENKENKMENDDSVQDITEVPTKCISYMQTLDINASIMFIDFEGRSDSESIKKILSMIKPRRLIIVRGPSEATEALATYCTSGAVQGKVFTPHLLEMVDATTESHIYQVKLKDSLVSSLDFVKSNDGDEKSEDTEKTKDEAEGDRIPVLQPIPTTQITGHPTIFINEVLLSDFKQVLMRNGINAEFSGGVLYCNDVVALRKNESGHIDFEGCLTEDYFKDY